MFASQIIKTDITAVKIADNRIFVGVGDHLHVYNHPEHKCLNEIPIFDGFKINGIVINQKNCKILVFGGWFAQILDHNLLKGESHKFNDWILAACWSQNFIALATMHNKLSVCNHNFTEIQTFQCPQKCNLYSAFIHRDCGGFTVFSGTVIGEILVWQVPKNQVLATLSGHKGAIFSIFYDKNSRYLCSSSDDRSIILWYVTSFTTITLKHTFFGHQSRVFRCVIYEDFVLSGGEDSFVNVWSLGGAFVRKIATHQGGPLWCLDVGNNVIVTGGADCGVLITSTKDSIRKKQLKIPNCQVPKSVGILFSGNLVTVCQTGTLFYCLFESSKIKWTLIAQHDKLKSYNLLQVSKCRKLVSLSSYFGDIFLYQEQNQHLSLLGEFHTSIPTRIFAFHWLTCQTFLTCQNNKLTLWYLTSKAIKPIQIFNLPEIKDNWSTSACQGHNGTILIGDKKGHIYVYSLSKQAPVQILKKVHNHLGITKIMNFDSKIVTLGRNGVVNNFMGDFRAVLPISSDKLPFSWLVGLENDKILAFSSTKFIVWDYLTRRICFDYECGGGHRSWDLFEKNKITSFVYLENSLANIITYNKTSTYPVNLISGYHTTTINTLKILKFKSNFLVISGAEDTTLRISVIATNTNFHQIEILKSHLSSVRALCLWHFQGHDLFLMFSAGGRGQIVTWLLSICSTNIKRTICCQQYNLYKNISSQQTSEVRIMDLCAVKVENKLCLFAATSEGRVNMYHVIERGAKFELIYVKDFFYEQRCVTKVGVLQINDFDWLLAMNTNGNLIFSNLRNEISHCFKLHTSGINSFSYYFLSDIEVVFLSGGDDAIIKLIVFEVKARSVRKLFEVKEYEAHCAQITGAFITKTHFLTASVDQKLLVFKWEVGSTGLRCKLLGKYESTIADIQGMECCENDGDFDVFLYGKGFEFIKVNKL